MNFPIKRILINLIEAMAEKVYIPMDKPEDMIILENISYCNDDLTKHKLDILYPCKKQIIYPVIFNIHGGAFCMNSKDLIYRNYGIKLAGNQFAVVNLNYRLSTEETFPTQIMDVSAALDYIYDNADKYQLDMKNVFITGDSAGAYMATMVGCIATSEQLWEYYQWKPKMSINAIAANCGMYDFDTYMQRDVKFPMKKSIVQMLFGSRKYREADGYAYSSVLKHVNEKFPPIYLMDTEVNSFDKEALRMQSKLEEKGIDYEIHIYSKEQKLVHAFNVFKETTQSEEVINQIFDFFQKRRTQL